MVDERSEVLRAEYRNRFSETAAYRSAVWKVLCGRFFSRYIPADARVLDLGSGWGEFINHVMASERHAMDLNPDAGTHLDPGTRFLQQDCAEPWPFPDASLDVVFTSNFLEHLPSKAHVERALAQAFRCLKPAGRLICLGPNIRCVPGPYWDFWDHVVPISDQSLAEVLRLTGFDIERCIERFLPYSMSTGRTPPLLFVRLYLAWPFAWRWFGKQFLVIGRKG